MQILTISFPYVFDYKIKNQIIARNTYYNSYKLLGKNLLKKNSE